MELARGMPRERDSPAESKNCEILLPPTADRRFDTKVKCPTGRASFWVKFPTVWNLTQVKCPGIAQGGMGGFGIDWYITFLYYANEESDDVIGGSINAVQHSTKNISRNIISQKKQNDTHGDVAMITVMPLVFVLSLYPSLRQCKRGYI